ncbi:MAG TPA: hypothetical protein VL137_11100, partial [Polyangiaceae bacterium]|nr:hypothetical protein [Polyangiaceae bacterium]
TIRGRADARSEHLWWKENRPDCPDKVLDELADVIERIGRMPKVHKPYGRLAGELIWRIKTAVTALHVYYTVDDLIETAHIEYVWGARRSETPPLDR